MGEGEQKLVGFPAPFGGAVERLELELRAFLRQLREPEGPMARFVERWVMKCADHRLGLLYWLEGRP
ncbi:hypothetical protein [Mumia zhuanghuii]|uniref:Uncharacterized protein n=1 Tax=Mumia zhuanghuii TaxID=2585211 RepID=A0A5C4M943_9ACTN|nr:hypothetical protein [Mumia zhuanghuii]TNC28419.1 hypothetical protein FHE65_33910 [Mumia zhuanghuii]